MWDVRARSQSGQVADPGSVENLVPFCGACLARADKNPRIFSVEVLATYKADHEARMAPREVNTRVRAAAMI